MILIDSNWCAFQIAQRAKEKKTRLNKAYKDFIQPQFHCVWIMSKCTITFYIMLTFVDFQKCCLPMSNALNACCSDKWLLTTLQSTISL